MWSNSCSVIASSLVKPIAKRCHLQCVMLHSTASCRGCGSPSHERSAVSGHLSCSFTDSVVDDSERPHSTAIGQERGAEDTDLPTFGESILVLDRTPETAANEPKALPRKD